MILIGQYDSPFVRRVGIALTLYGMAFEHRPWSTFGDAEKIRPYSPLMRVPVLVLDNGEVLPDSSSIIDHIDRNAPAGRSLLPAEGRDRDRALRIVALAAGLSDKAVALFYEQRLHKDVSDIWVERCRAQIDGALAALETDLAGRKTLYWFGERIGHADIAVGAAMRHFAEAHPGLVDMENFPAVAGHCRTLEALPVFQEISQPFIAPA